MNTHINTVPGRSQINPEYTRPTVIYSLWQIVNSVVPYLALNYLMYLSLSVSYWLTLALSVLAAAFMARIFILFHDCGHGSFFRSMQLNKWVGIVLGLFSYTSYHKWKRNHSIHHGTVGNLDKRGIGDVQTLTVEEYKALSPGRQLRYRIYRHPLFLLGIGGVFLYVVMNRFTSKALDQNDRLWVHITNVILTGAFIGLGYAIGFKELILIQLPIIYFASSAGVWLFYVQHQYEDVEWRRDPDWNYKELALKGSSFLKLPRILQWFSGSIGFHHVHHLSPRIPNYYLEECHNSTPILKEVKPLSFSGSLRAARLALWDEASGRLIGFKTLHKGAFQEA
jgi:acyl-lipid omega-6 desaturase (Delta-12 desaturase)